MNNITQFGLEKNKLQLLPSYQREIAFRTEVVDEKIQDRRVGCICSSVALTVFAVIAAIGAAALIATSGGPHGNMPSFYVGVGLGTTSAGLVIWMVMVVVRANRYYKDQRNTVLQKNQELVGNDQILLEMRSAKTEKEAIYDVIIEQMREKDQFAAFVTTALEEILPIPIGYSLTTQEWEIFSTITRHEYFYSVIENSEAEKTEALISPNIQKKILDLVNSVCFSGAPNVVIVGNKDSQVERFRMLETMDEYVQRNPLLNDSSQVMYYPECDRYRYCSPTNNARIFLEGETPTNGAEWRGLILIQGPHTELHKEHLWRIAYQKRAPAIVRLGPIIGYDGYTPSYNQPLDYGNFSVYSEDEAPDTPFFSTTCINYSLKTEDGNQHNLSLYAVEGWKDGVNHSVDEIYKLILELDQLEKNIILHSRAGIGRTGTFAVCWEIYQTYKWAVENSKLSTIDPVDIILEVRNARINTVQDIRQFEMILEFFDHLVEHFTKGFVN